MLNGKISNATDTQLSTPLSTCTLDNVVSTVKNGFACVSFQLSPSAITTLENGKILVTGLPKPRKAMILYGEQWNNGFTDGSRPPLRLRLNLNGELYSHYPSSVERLNEGCPVNINAFYVVAEN